MKEKSLLRLITKRIAGELPAPLDRLHESARIAVALPPALGVFPVSLRLHASIIERPGAGDVVLARFKAGNDLVAEYVGSKTPAVISMRDLQTRQTSDYPKTELSGVWPIVEVSQQIPAGNNVASSSRQRLTAGGRRTMRKSVKKF